MSNLQMPDSAAKRKHLAAMKLQAVNRIAADPHVTAFEVRLLVTLFPYFDEDGDQQEAFPSQDLLVSVTGATRRGVQLALDQLVEIGYLTRKVGGGKRGERNHYGLVDFTNKGRTGVRPKTDLPTSFRRPVRANPDSDLGRTGIRPHLSTSTPFREGRGAKKHPLPSRSQTHTGTEKGVSDAAKIGAVAPAASLAPPRVQERKEAEVKKESPTREASKQPRPKRVLTPDEEESRRILAKANADADRRGEIEYAQREAERAAAKAARDKAKAERGAEAKAKPTATVVAFPIQSTRH